jgi:concentrative nucleoside transporter, CNT family
VRGMAWLLERTLGVGGAVGLSTAANIFLGMVEAPLFIRPYLAQLTRSELFLVMTGGMAGIAGTVLVLYATLLAPLIPDAAAHFVIASVLGAPAAILVSLIMVPETSDKRTGGALYDPRGALADPRGALADPRVALADPRGALADPDMHAASTMDAIVKGTVAGLELLLNIIAMLIVLVALVYLANAILGLLPNVGGAGISLQRLLGYAMAPVCWLMGLPWPQAITAGSLMGVKTVLNELIAYVDLSKLGPDALDPRSRLIMLYAMCGFANFGSLGIMIGGIGTMAPDRRDEINSLGLKSIVSGTLTTCLMGAIVGMLT